MDLHLRANNNKMGWSLTLYLSEDYLYGVVPQEVVPSLASSSIIEAISCSSSTYALHTMEENKGKLYDE